VCLDRCLFLKVEVETQLGFRILDKEWSKLKKRYLKYLKKKNFDKNFRQIKKI
jgi:hypothetical protein